MCFRRCTRVSVAALAILSGACSAPEDPETALRRIVAELIEAIESKDVDPVLERVAVSFRSEPGERQQGLDYPAVQSIVLEFLLREQPIGARALDVTVLAGEAEGEHRVLVEVWFATGGSLRDPATPLPAGAVRYAFDLIFALEHETWKAVGGRFEREGSL